MEGLVGFDCGDYFGGYMCGKLKIVAAFLINEKGILRELEVLRRGANERVKVENEMALWLKENRTAFLPCARVINDWMRRLGVPPEYR
jgi:hypothetical protein